MTKVIDGDTIDVELASGPIRVRFHAIDAPERNQPGGKEATAALSRMVYGKEVELEPFSQDRYDRLIARVYADELDVNGEMIRQGHGWAFRRYMKRDDARYCKLEAEARATMRGLWKLQMDQQVAPWEWRRRRELRMFTDYASQTVEDCIAAIGDEPD